MTNAMQKCMACHVSELETVKGLLFLFACYWVFKILNLLAGNGIACFEYRPKNKRWILLMIEYQLIEKPQKAENPTCFCNGFIIPLRWLHFGNKQMKNLSNFALVSLNNSTIKIAECILYCQHSITFDVTGSAIKRFIVRKEKKEKTNKQHKQTYKKQQIDYISHLKIFGDKILEILPRMESVLNSWRVS